MKATIRIVFVLFLATFSLISLLLIKVGNNDYLLVKMKVNQIAQSAAVLGMSASEYSYGTFAAAPGISIQQRRMVYECLSTFLELEAPTFTASNKWRNYKGFTLVRYVFDANTNTVQRLQYVSATGVNSRAVLGTLAGTYYYTDPKGKQIRITTDTLIVEVDLGNTTNNILGMNKADSKVVGIGVVRGY